MTKIIDKVLNHYFQTVEELWEASGARVVEEYEIEKGHTETVAFFDSLEVDESRTTKTESPLRTLRGREIGTQVTYKVVMSDGIDRLTIADKLDDRWRSDDDVILTRGAEWMTASGPKSFASDHLRRATVVNGLNNIHVGAGHSTTQLPHGLDWLRVPRTVNQSLNHSLAKAAFTKQSIIDYVIRDQHGEFATSQVGLGGSMDKMEKPAERFYAGQFGNSMEQEVTIAPCGLEGLTQEDASKILLWAMAEAKALPPVVIERIKHGRFRRTLGTATLNANFWASALIGSAPALGSGEAGKVAQWPRYDSHGYTRLLSKDGMSSPDWALHSRLFPNMHYDTTDGYHVDLGRVSINDELHDVLARYIEQRRLHGGNVDAINRPYVYLSRSTELEDAA